MKNLSRYLAEVRSTVARLNFPYVVACLHWLPITMTSKPPGTLCVEIHIDFCCFCSLKLKFWNMCTYFFPLTRNVLPNHWFVFLDWLFVANQNLHKIGCKIVSWLSWSHVSSDCLAGEMCCILNCCINSVGFLRADNLCPLCAMVTPGSNKVPDMGPLLLYIWVSNCLQCQPPMSDRLTPSCSKSNCLLTYLGKHQKMVLHPPGRLAEAQGSWVWPCAALVVVVIRGRSFSVSLAFQWNKNRSLWKHRAHGR